MNEFFKKPVVKILMLKGEKGDKGNTGTGTPKGGKTGQYLLKKSDADYDYVWSPITTVSWGNVSGKTNATESAAGLMSAEDKSKLDNLQVGGRNLLTDTNKGVANWSFNSSSANASVSEKLFTDFGIPGGVMGVRIDITKNSTNPKDWAYVSFYNRNLKYIINRNASTGEHLTMSFDLKTDYSGNIETNICDINGTNNMAAFGLFLCKPNAWVHVELTSQSIKSTVSEQVIYYDVRPVVASSKYIEIVNLKLERGTVATDWTPAPEDTDNKITALDSKIDGVDSKIDALNSVTKNFTLSASSWSSGSYTISDSLITATSNQEILPATSITADQMKALQKANIIDSGQSAGKLTLKALGTVPTIDIPIRVIFRGTI